MMNEKFSADKNLAAPEKNKKEIPELNEGMKKLTAYLETMAESMRGEGIPVKNDCRVDMDAFKDLHSPQDLAAEKQRLLKIQKELAEKDDYQENFGEKLEMLKTAVFNKFLGQKFIVARTNLADDIDRGVDNIILEKQTGNVVCAFDEVADIVGKTYQDKTAKILGKNVESAGASLKYGLGIDKKTKKVIPQSVQNIPIFYLALPGQYVKNAIQQFKPEVKSEQESKLLLYFLSSLQTQIKALDLRMLSVHPEVRTKIEKFDLALKILAKEGGGQKN
jgi:hypothetical protein